MANLGAGGEYILENTTQGHYIMYLTPHGEGRGWQLLLKHKESNNSDPRLVATVKGILLHLELGSQVASTKLH